MLARQFYAQYEIGSQRKLYRKEPNENKSIVICITGLNRYVVDQGCRIVDGTQHLNNHEFVMLSQPWQLHS